MKKVVFPVLYAAPIRYFLLLLQDNEIAFEKHENFVKSSFRNRTYVASPNGALRLTIPIKGGKSKHQKYFDLLIDNTQEWQKNHWQSLTTAYRSSAYFEYYEDDLYMFYHETANSLFEFNMKLFEWLIRQLDFDVNFTYTDVYNEEIEPDHRKQFKTPVSDSLPPYYQVFEKKTAFIPGLSIYDLLFNLGPEAHSYLKNACFIGKP
ncbi:MAG: hypothetical protein HKN92_08805 [Chitinophagales bacterium]|nr:hypothetical protein [Chitinophagales bacterium]